MISGGVDHSEMNQKGMPNLSVVGKPAIFGKSHIIFINVAKASKEDINKAGHDIIRLTIVQISMQSFFLCIINQYLKIFFLLWCITICYRMVAKTFHWYPSLFILDTTGFDVHYQ